ncbi:hypothetical protein BDP27DRAFT_1480137 [Rhodocollybia butyracea]|uniref:Uncharacterized protein n=1 Tax=Rhodocollybia butyracea TaxID=206335 RepID=A0A9P5PGR7_9AGAR|nr:hypothetical protein BDP27DRAFT_1480137 [Rhodocollybia butyracea]
MIHRNLVIKPESQGSASESVVSKKFLETETLQGVGSDPLWLDDLVKIYPRCGGGGEREYNWATSEVNEIQVDIWSVLHGELASAFSHCVHGWRINLAVQAKDIISGGGSTQPDLQFYSLNNRLFVCWMNKCLSVMMVHWFSIHKDIFSLVDLRKGETSSMAMFRQAYASTTSSKHDCCVVYMGHLALYRFLTFLSSFYNASFSISKGNLLSETLALAYMSKVSLDMFLLNCSPTLPTLPSPVICCTTLETNNNVWSALQLEGKIFNGKGQSLNFPSCIKYGRVWKNDGVVAKAVTCKCGPPRQARGSGSGAKQEGSDIDLLEYKWRQHSSECLANCKHGKELFLFGKMLKFKGAAIIQWNTSDVK